MYRPIFPFTFIYNSNALVVSGILFCHRKTMQKSNGNDKMDASHVVHTKSVNSYLKTLKSGGEYKCCKSEPENGKLSEQNSFENISKVTLVLL